MHTSGLDIYKVEQKKGAKLGEGSSARADWLCIGCLRLVGSRREGNSNREHFFCTRLYEGNSLIA